jgi:hypothetical protein
MIYTRILDIWNKILNFVNYGKFMKLLDPIYQQNCRKVMYQYRKPEYIKVQCISTKCGLYKDLKFGQWYDVIEDDDYFRIEDNSAIGSRYSNYYRYEKSLFRTIDQRRDSKLNKILCG